MLLLAIHSCWRFIQDSCGDYHQQATSLDAGFSQFEIWGVIMMKHRIF
jgi:hypothetical protein